MSVMHTEDDVLDEQGTDGNSRLNHENGNGDACLGGTAPLTLSRGLGPIFDWLFGGGDDVARMRMHVR